MQKAVSNFVGLFRYHEFHKSINAEKMTNEELCKIRFPEEVDCIKIKTKK